MDSQTLYSKITANHTFLLMVRCSFVQYKHKWQKAQIKQTHQHRSAAPSIFTPVPYLVGKGRFMRL
uniref:Uncharacterized protein n=1 Tax=Arundo donax TaxID=35708 RepID=A0A0A8ZH04_ARUDO